MSDTQVVPEGTALLSPEAMGTFDESGVYHPRSVTEDDLGGASLEDAMAGTIVEFEDGSVRIVGRHQRFVGAAERHAPADVGTPDGRSRTKCAIECLDEQGGVGRGQINPRPEQHDVRDHRR